MSSDQPVVLVVEDDLDLRRVYGLTFRLAGFRVEVCKTLSDAWAAFSQGRPRVVWLNPGSENPGDKWTEFALHVQNSPGPPVRVVVVTASTDPSIRSFCIDNGLRYHWKPHSDYQDDVAVVVEEMEAASRPEPAGASEDGGPRDDQC